LVDLIKLIDPLEQKFEQEYKKITAELSKYTSANESSNSNTYTMAEQQNLSLAQLKKRYKNCRKKPKP
jgi:DNA repair exonuclease SbcCD ATPase subunit